MLRSASMTLLFGLQRTATGTRVGRTSRVAQRKGSSQASILAAFGAPLLGVAMPYVNAQELTVYSYLTPQFLQPVLSAFSYETGIAVDAQYMTANQLLERLLTERDGPSADVVFTMEGKRLADLVAADVLAPQSSAVLKNAIPTHFRHPADLWFGLSKWSRTIYYSTERVKPEELTRYADLADPRWHGRVCVRPSNKTYVQSLIASTIANEGEQAARTFVRGIVANLARPPVDLDVVQLEAIAAGNCDLTLANSYYYARIVTLLTSPLESDRGGKPRQLVAAVAPLALAQNGRGVHMNISGFALTRASKQPALARRLMEYMVQPLAQSLYAAASQDFPIIDGVRSGASKEIFGEFKEDLLPIAQLASHYQLAERISKEEGWLWK